MERPERDERRDELDSGDYRPDAVPEAPWSITIWPATRLGRLVQRPDFGNDPPDDKAEDDFADAAKTNFHAG